MTDRRSLALLVACGVLAMTSFADAETLERTTCGQVTDRDTCSAISEEAACTDIHLNPMCEWTGDTPTPCKARAMYEYMLTARPMELAWRAHICGDATEADCTGHTLEDAGCLWKDNVCAPDARITKYLLDDPVSAWLAESQLACIKYTSDGDCTKNQFSHCAWDPNGFFPWNQADNKTGICILDPEYTVTTTKQMCKGEPLTRRTPELTCEIKAYMDECSAVTHKETCATFAQGHCRWMNSLNYGQGGCMAMATYVEDHYPQIEALRAVIMNDARVCHNLDEMGCFDEMTVCKWDNDAKRCVWNPDDLVNGLLDGVTSRLMTTQVQACDSVASASEITCHWPCYYHSWDHCSAMLWETIRSVAPCTGKVVPGGGDNGNPVPMVKRSRLAGAGVLGGFLMLCFVAIGVVVYRKREGLPVLPSSAASGGSGYSSSL